MTPEKQLFKLAINYSISGALAQGLEIDEVVLLLHEIAGDYEHELQKEYE
jgi:hypothetical protein